MNSISPHDLQVLANYQFIEDAKNRQNSRLLGLEWVKENSTWKQRLVCVERQDISLWTKFLRLFNMGKLKNTYLSLSEINSHLSQYQWKEIKKMPDGEKAFYTVCHIANRQIGPDSKLFKAVSDPMEGDFKHYWNPAMQGRFLRNLHKYILPTVIDVELRFKDSKKIVLSHQILTKVDVENVEVGYRYEEGFIIRKKNLKNEFEWITHHLPSPPYYLVKPVLPFRREL